MPFPIYFMDLKEEEEKEKRNKEKIIENAKKRIDKKAKKAEEKAKKKAEKKVAQEAGAAKEAGASQETAVEAEEEKEEEEFDFDDSEPLGPTQINDIHPLWLKNPKDCTDEEYKAFYRKAFADYREPLFWIHLNMDYPFNLKGILYFPQTDNTYESLEGRIKLFYNQVFVADNIKEVIPDFLFLLKGCIDCLDLSLNVFRSFL